MWDSYQESIQNKQNKKPKHNNSWARVEGNENVVWVKKKKKHNNEAITME